MSALSERVMYDATFQAACQRYAHAGGSSSAIAAAAVKASAADDMLDALQAVELARHTDETADWQRATKLSNAAIARATGAA